MSFHFPSLAQSQAVAFYGNLLRIGTIAKIESDFTVRPQRYLLLQTLRARHITIWRKCTHSTAGKLLQRPKQRQSFRRKFFHDAIRFSEQSTTFSFHGSTYRTSSSHLRNCLRTWQIPRVISKTSFRYGRAWFTFHQPTDSQKATRIFYSKSCFRFELPEVHNKRRSIDFLEGEDRVRLTHIDKLKKMRRVRHICFRLYDNADMHDVYIDFGNVSVDNWLISSDDMPLKCPCQTPKQRPVLQWREHIAATAFSFSTLFPFRMTSILKRVDLCIKPANKAVKRFQTLCVTKSGKLVTGIPGLAYLTQAAWFVLDARSQWVDAMGYEGESDLDEDETRAELDDHETWWTTIKNIVSSRHHTDMQDTETVNRIQ